MLTNVNNGNFQIEMYKWTVCEWPTEIKKTHIVNIKDVFGIKQNNIQNNFLIYYK